MRFFEMDLAKTNMLVSIEYQALLADIEQTKKKSLRAGKEQWLQDWERDVSAEFTLFSFEELRKRRRESRHIRQWDGRSWWRWKLRSSCRISLCLRVPEIRLARN